VRVRFVAEKEQLGDRGRDASSLPCPKSAG
jgi:hypothetical protein